MMMTLIKISKKNPVSCKIRIILMMRRMRMAKMMRMTRVVSEIFTQGSFTRPLQKLLPTETVAVLPTFLRCYIVMMMMMMMVTAYKAIIITITTVITVAVMTSCEKFTEWGRGNCTDVRIDSLNDWRINRCPRVVWTKEILFKISIKSTLVKCFFFIYL